MQQLEKDVWEEKFKFDSEESLDDSFERISHPISLGDESFRKSVLKAMKDRDLIPAGRIIAGAGTGRRVTLINCYTGPEIQDSLSSEGDGFGIMSALEISAVTQQMGGGIGNDFSTIRPKGALVKRTGSISSGVLPFMNMWHSMCSTIRSSGSRRGAMMGTLAISHPDILDFIKSKKKEGALTNFNISVLVSNKFMEALRNDEDWPLYFPVPHANKQLPTLNLDGVEVFVYDTVKAKFLWDELTKNTYEDSEPGVIFIDRINELNNLKYCERIHCTNPCGEQPLPPFGDCNLGHVNLATHIIDPFRDSARIDYERLKRSVRLMQRALDNVLDVTHYPTEMQEREAQQKRRTGLGFTGLANAFQQLRIPYGSDHSVKLASSITKMIAEEAYRESIQLAKERGPFPLFNKEEFLKSPFVQKLPKDIQEGIATHGIRNGVLLSIAPTGTTSILAGNVSSGLEPVFLHAYNRKVRQSNSSEDDEWKEYKAYDYGYLLWKKYEGFPDDEEPHTLPDFLNTASDLTVEHHLRIQGAVQEWIDASISKTTNVPTDIPFKDFQKVYQRAWDLGCKGCTTYRFNPDSKRGSILSEEKKEKNSLAEAKDLLPMSDVLEGRRYRVNWPMSESAYYVVINDIMLEGKRRPFEIFINSKAATHDEWVKALTLMITGIFRRGGDIDFVAEELKQVFAATGGAFLDGGYKNSLVAAIAYRIEEHFNFLRDLNSEERELPEEGPSQYALICPKCNSPTFFKKEGCKTCDTCGYSACG